MRRRAGLSVAAVAFLVVLVVAPAAAGPNLEILSVNAPSFVEPGETLQVEVEVKNTAGEEVHQMEVKAKGFDQVKEENLYGLDPGEKDTLTFYLDAPSDQNGTYELEITAQSRDEDGNVIGGEMRTLEVDVGEEREVLAEEGKLSIATITAPASLVPGQRFHLKVNVSNTGERDISGVQVAVEAFGVTMRKDVGIVREDSYQEVPVEVNVPGAARGKEEARVTVSSFSGRDTVNITLSVSSVRATFQLRQETVAVGEPVTVSGILSRRNAKAELFYAGRYETTVFSDNTGHFTHTLIPRAPGTFRVVLSTDGGRIEKFLTVNPKIEVKEISAPVRVGKGSIFDVCVVVSRASKGETSLSLLVDGEERKTATIAGKSAEYCFPVSLSSAGNHTLTIEASSGGVSDTEEKVVEAVQTGLSASVFPEQLTLTRGQAGVFQVEIQNDRLEARQFDIEVEGLQNLSLQAPSTVQLERGGSGTAVVRVVPQTTGTYTGTITVSNRGTVITEAKVEVDSVENPALRNPVIGGVAGRVSDAAESFQELGKWKRWTILGIGAVLILGIIWYWRRRRSEVIEPQY
ncbi:MAG: hypothetical protein ABEI07_02445 [Candidatus Nanohaloarchaea archaeon]